MFSTLSTVTREQGFHSRTDLVARYEEGSGRSVGALNWYQALALWKAAVFMEGNYRAFLAGSNDDDFLATLDEGVPALAEKAREIALA
jgi:aminoglycoside phosphotransferase (APT) family kinase protein